MPRRPARGRMLVLALTFAVTTVGILAVPGPVLGWDAGTYSSASEGELFTLTNQARAAAGLKPLKSDSALVTLARWRSKDMSDRDYFSHNIPPGGTMVFDYMQDQGYCFKLAGENIGWNTYPDDSATATIQQMFMDSPGHRENILGASWDVMGIGAYQGADGKKLWTVLFADSCSIASPTPTPIPTPKPTPNPTPKPTPEATPEPTPRQVQTPTPVPTLEPTQTQTAEPSPTPTPTPAPPLEPTPALVPSAPEPTSTATPEPTPTPTIEPALVALGPTSGPALRVVDAPAPQGLLETIVGGVAGFFFRS